MKILAGVLAGVVVLVLVLLIAERAGDSTYYYNDYGDSYADDDPWFVYTEPSPEEALVGDWILFGGAQWRVLDRDMIDGILLLMDNEIYLSPEEAQAYPGESGYDFEGGVVHWGGAAFAAEEFTSIQRMFLLSPEEMEQYGIEPPLAWFDELVPVRPAMWISIDSD